MTNEKRGEEEVSEDIRGVDQKLKRKRKEGMKPGQRRAKKQQQQQQKQLIEAGS